MSPESNSHPSDSSHSSSEKYKQYRQEKPIGDETKRQVFSWLKELKERGIRTLEETPIIKSKDIDKPEQENVQSNPKLFQGRLSKSGTSQENSSASPDNNGKVALTESDRQNLATLKKM